MKGLAVVESLKKKLRVETDTALSKKVGITAQAIQNWKNRRSVTPRQLAGLVYSVSRAATTDFESTAIRPLVEFFRIEKVGPKKKSNGKLINIMGEDGRRHPYLEGLRKELEAHHGVYIFFDSRGHAIYVGKARRQSLWKEMNLALNRARGEIQKIKRVRHPTRKQPYRTSDEKTRQITDHLVPIYELASYFSAYRVADSMIGVVEAMLVRSFANDLLNKKMEKFAGKKHK